MSSSFRSSRHSAHGSFYLSFWLRLTRAYVGMAEYVVRVAHIDDVGSEYRHDRDEESRREYSALSDHRFEEGVRDI